MARQPLSEIFNDKATTDIQIDFTPKAQYAPFSPSGQQASSATPSFDTSSFTTQQSTPLQIQSNPVFQYGQEMDRIISQSTFEPGPSGYVLPQKRGLELVESIVDQNLLDPVFNSDTGRAALGQFSKTENLGWKTAALLHSQADPRFNFTESYNAINSWAKDPNANEFVRFIDGVQNAGGQSALGVALNFVPYAGKPLASIYWTGLSAKEQLDTQGKVTSSGKLAIDVAGDIILGNAIEGFLKSPAQTMVGAMAQGFGIEGGTEPSQTLLKYGVDYKKATTDEEKRNVINEVKNYITSGDILREIAVAGTSGGLITGGSLALNSAVQAYEATGNKEGGFIKIPGQDSAPAQSLEKGTSGRSTTEIIDSHFDTAKMLQDQVGPQGVEDFGGQQAFVDQSVKNLADALRVDGQKYLASEISKIDTKGKTITEAQTEAKNIYNQALSQNKEAGFIRLPDFPDLNPEQQTRLATLIEKGVVNVVLNEQGGRTFEVQVGDQTQTTDNADDAIVLAEAGSNILPGQVTQFEATQTQEGLDIGTQIQALQTEQQQTETQEQLLDIQDQIASIETRLDELFTPSEGSVKLLDINDSIEINDIQIDSETIDPAEFIGVITDMADFQGTQIIIPSDVAVSIGQNIPNITQFGFVRRNDGSLVRAPQVTSRETSPTLSRGQRAQEIQSVNSYKRTVQQDSNFDNRVFDETAKKDFTGTVKDNAEPTFEETDDSLTSTRKFKQTDEYKEFARYAEANLQDVDIKPSILSRHATLTMERVAEILDGGLGGQTYQTIVEPVYTAAEDMLREGNETKDEVMGFNVIEGTTTDKDASLYAQKKIDDASPKAKALADYVRNKYDEYLERLNVERAKLGVEPIKRRKDYITHLNELNTLSELFGGIERLTVKKRISQEKSRLLEEHPDWDETRAFEAAKRKVEGLTGIEMYVDARQPTFKFAKERLSEYEKNPSILRSFNAYMPNALRYIYQGENVARNKAFSDLLPAHAKQFAKMWNTEQVAGRVPKSVLNPTAKRAVNALKGTLGANTIAGNLATTAMQLTSFPQVFALAGARNTFYGIGSRLRTYIPGQVNQFDQSRTKALRTLDMDMGLGDSLIDQLLLKMERVNGARNVSARSRYAIDFGREMLKGIMEVADQFTVGATYQAFYRKAVLEGETPENAARFAELMTGKTQANYFREALPPFLNTFEGKTLGQFGTYSMNQFEMFKRDFGREFKFNESNVKTKKEFFKQFLVFLFAAYLIDALGEELFGRQPYDVKELVDETISFTEDESTGPQLWDTAKDTALSYIPFMGSVKFGSAPPVLEFGKDTVNALLGSGQSQDDAIKNMKEKWAYNILLPYGGNQVRKSLQGIEAATDIDVPFVRDVSANKFEIETAFDSAKAILFGPYSSEAATVYYEDIERKEAIKQQYNISGSITSDENIAKLKRMTPEQFDSYTKGYADSTKATIEKKMGQTSSTKSKSLDEIFSTTNGRQPLSEIFSQ